MAECLDCGRELPAGGRGRPRKRCDDCGRKHKNAARRQPAPAKAKQATTRKPKRHGPADGDGDGVEAATRAELEEMPEHLARSATAAAALELARSIDLGEYSFRFQAGLVKELRECMNELRKQAPAKERDSLDDLAARRAARRGAASAS